MKTVSFAVLLLFFKTKSNIGFSLFLGGQQEGRGLRQASYSDGSKAGLRPGGRCELGGKDGLSNRKAACVCFLTLDASPL